VSGVGETFEPRGLEGLGRPLYTRSERDVTVRLRLGPGARWVAEYYEVERTADGPDGTLDVTIPAKDLAWTTKLVLRLAGEAEVLDPPELRTMVAEEARAALGRYTAD
jgi:proteasome accessory factor C